MKRKPFILLFWIMLLSSFSAFGQVSENMNVIGRWGYGACNANSVYGSYLLMANGAMLEVVEVRGTRPYLVQRGKILLPDVVNGIYVAWPKAYAACEDAGLVIVDLSSPNNPVIQGSYDTEGQAVGVNVYGDYAYVADGSGGMVIVNISSPFSPYRTAAFKMEGAIVWDVWADENIAYVAAGTGGFWTVNVSNRFAPSLLDSVHVSGTVKAVAIQRSTAYLACGSSGLKQVNIANPSNIAVTSTWKLAGPMDVTDVYVRTSMAYLTDALFGVRVLDVSVDPKNISNLSTRGSAQAITLNASSSAFVACGGAGMLLLDVFGTAPLRVDSLSTGDESVDVLIHGNLVYVAGGQSGMWILNRAKANTSSIDVSGRLTEFVYCQGLAKKDTLLFIADGSAGLKVYNIRRPGTPVLLSSRSVSNWASDVDVYGNQVVVADGTSGLHLFSISNPREVTDLGTISLGPTTARKVKVDARRNLAYASTSTGTKVVDLQNKIMLGSCPGSSDAYSADISEDGNTLCVADGDNGIMGFDVTNATNPRLIETLRYNTPGTASDILIKGSAVIVADGEGTVRIVDFSGSSKGTAPREVGYYHSAGSSLRLDGSQDTLAVADGQAGIYLFKGNFAGTLVSRQNNLDFAAVMVGKKRVLSLQLSNTGTSPVQIRNVTSTTGRFGAESNLPITILPGSMANLIVAFTPLVQQTLTDVLVIESDANNNPLRINVRGTGVQTVPLESYLPDYYTFLLYHMTNTIRDTLILDESLYGYLDGALYNASLSSPDSGRFGRALVLGSEESKVRVRMDSINFLPDNQGFTVDTWFKLTKSQKGRKSIFKISQGTRILFDLGVDDLENQRVLAARSMRTAQDTVRLKAGADYTLSLYKWYHAALVYDGSFKLYLNGTRVDSVKASLYEDQSPMTMVLGYTGKEGSMVGYVDEFRLSGVSRAPWEFNVSTGRIVVSTNSLNFGNVMLPNTRTLAVWVQNTGPGTLWIDSVKTSNPRYTASPRSFTLSPGSAGYVYMTFAPLVVGTTGGVLNIFSRDPYAPVKSILLTGNGYTKGTPGPYSTDFYTAGLWHFEGLPGDTVIQDASSYNLRGYFRGSGIYWDRAIYRWGVTSLYFNGGSGWMRVPYHEILNFTSTPFSIEMWFRLGAKPQSGYASLLRRGWGGNAQYEILYGDSLETGRGLSARLYSASGQALTLRGPTDGEMHIGSWYHFALTWDKSKIRLFLNGMKVDSVAFSGNLRASTADLSVGGSYGRGRGFNGYIDEMRLSTIDRQGWEFNLVGSRLYTTASSVIFGQVLLGESSAQDLVFSNNGDQPLVISGIQTKTRSFSVQPTTAQINMGQNQSIRVTFAPQTTGLLKDTLRITSNDPNQNTLSIAMSGTGVNYRSKIPYALDDYTLALFHFDETSGNTTPDAKAGLHNGTLMNGVSRTTDGYFSGAVRLDGKDDYITIPSANDLVFDMTNQSFTIECFFRTDTLSQSLFFKDISAGSEKANYGLSVDNAGKSSAYGFGTSSLWVSDGAWHHAAFVYDSQTKYGMLYIDGSLLVQQVWTTDKTDNKNPRALILGAREISAGSFIDHFEGDLDELRISSVARKPWEFLFARSGIDVALPAVPVTGTTQNVNITVPSDTVTKTITLYYRKGGETAYAAVAATSSDRVNYRAVIPAQNVTFNGLEYYVEKSTSREKTTQPLYDPIHRPIAAAVRFTAQTAEITLPAKKYTMISVPADLSKPSVYEVLHDDMGKYDPYNWRCFAFKDTAYVEFSDTLAYQDSAYFNLTRGRAFWIIPSQSKTFNVGSGYTAALESPFKLTVKPQWNMVGSVFPFPVAWDDCALSSESVGTLYYYDSKDGYRLDWPVMDSWRGYWLYNADIKQQTVYVPPRKSASGKGVPKRGILKDLAGGEWIFRISVETEQAKDLDNYMGVRNQARDEWDLLDRAEPPPIGDYITLYVDHSNWQEHGGTYAADIREPGKDGYIWDVVVETRLIRQNIGMHWEWNQNLPEGWVAYLIDGTDGSSIPVVEKKTYSFTTGNKAPSVRHFTFLAGTPEFVEKKSEVPLHPVEFHLAQNYPNPFNPQTTIQYTLPKTGKVHLAVYNMLGQEVRALVDDVQKAGTHEAIWDGSDQNGLKMPSGIYLYRLESIDRIAIRKLILVK